jgi:hypothetical protein
MDYDQKKNCRYAVWNIECSVCHFIGNGCHQNLDLLGVADSHRSDIHCFGSLQ